MLYGLSDIINLRSIISACGPHVLRIKFRNLWNVLGHAIACWSGPTPCRLRGPEKPWRNVQRFQLATLCHYGTDSRGWLPGQTRFPSILPVAASWPGRPDIMIPVAQVASDSEILTVSHRAWVSLAVRLARAPSQSQSRSHRPRHGRDPRLRLASVSASLSDGRLMIWYQNPVLGPWAMRPRPGPLLRPGPESLDAAQPKQARPKHCQCQPSKLVPPKHWRWQSWLSHSARASARPPWSLAAGLGPAWQLPGPGLRRRLGSEFDGTGNLGLEQAEGPAGPSRYGRPGAGTCPTIENLNLKSVLLPGGPVLRLQPGKGLFLNKSLTLLETCLPAFPPVPPAASDRDSVTVSDRDSERRCVGEPVAGTGCQCPLPCWVWVDTPGSDKSSFALNWLLFEQFEIANSKWHFLLFENPTIWFDYYSTIFSIFQLFYTLAFDCY